MDVSYGPKEFDQILEGLGCLVVDFWFYVVKPLEATEEFWGNQSGRKNQDGGNGGQVGRSEDLARSDRSLNKQIQVEDWEDPMVYINNCGGGINGMNKM